MIGSGSIAMASGLFEAPVGGKGPQAEARRRRPWHRSRLAERSRAWPVREIADRLRAALLADAQQRRIGYGIADQQRLRSLC